MSTSPICAYYALARQDADGVRTVSPQIPCFPVEDPDRISLPEVNRRAAAVHGGVVAVHRTYLSYGSGRLEKVLFVGEMIADDPRPLGVSSSAGLKELPVDDAWLKRSLSIYLENERSADEEVEWYRPGWFRAAVDQLSVLLAHRGMHLSGDPEQYRCGRESALIRAVTSEGTVFCKKLAAGRDRERPITSLLRSVLPTYIPRLLDNPDDDWLISFEDGYSPLSDLPDLDSRVRAAQAYARFQRAAAPYQERLVEAGALDWTPERIRREAAELYDRIGLLIPRSRREAWQAHFDRFTATCRRLLDLRLRPVVQHDDLHAANVVLSAEGVKFLDWAYLSVGAPVFSVSGLLYPAGDWNSTSAKAALDEAYLRELRPDYSADGVAAARALRTEYGPFGALMETYRQYLSGRIDRGRYKASLSQMLWSEGGQEKTQ